MSLTDDLDKARAASADRIPSETLTKMRAATEDLIASGLAEQSLGEGSAAPSFELPNATGNAVKVDALWEEGPVVVSFYRGGWCPYCNIELKALQDKLPEIEALGARLVAITPETPDNSLATKEKNELSFEVLSDQGNEVAKSFGLVFEVPDEIDGIYRGFGIDLEASNGDKSNTLPIPATYVIGKGGKVVKAYADADHTKRLDPDDILAALKAAAD